jgi:hypothetical protein
MAILSCHVSIKLPPPKSVTVSEFEQFERYEPDQDCAEPSPPWTGAGAMTRATMRTARSIQALLNPIVHNLSRQ